MIGIDDKLGLLKDFLASDFYCGLNPATEEKIITIRQTLEEYIAWSYSNIPAPRAELFDVITAGQVVMADCNDLLTAGDYNDVSVILGHIADGLEKVNIL